MHVSGLSPGPSSTASTTQSHLPAAGSKSLDQASSSNAARLPPPRRTSRPGRSPGGPLPTAWPTDGPAPKRTLRQADTDDLQQLKTLWTQGSGSACMCCAFFFGCLLSMFDVSRDRSSASNRSCSTIYMDHKHAVTQPSVSSNVQSPILLQVYHCSSDAIRPRHSLPGGQGGLGATVSTRGLGDNQSCLP